MPKGNDTLPECDCWLWNEHIGGPRKACPVCAGKEVPLERAREWELFIRVTQDPVHEEQPSGALVTHKTGLHLYGSISSWQDLPPGDYLLVPLAKERRPDDGS